jgi:hypothetical protein
MGTEIPIDCNWLGTQQFFQLIAPDYVLKSFPSLQDDFTLA